MVILNPIYSHFVKQTIKSPKRGIFFPFLGLTYHQMLKPKTIFSKYQQQELERAFLENAYLEKDRREALASVLALTEYQVSIWFQNRRARSKQKLQ